MEDAARDVKEDEDADADADADEGADADDEWSEIGSTTTFSFFSGGSEYIVSGGSEDSW